MDNETKKPSPASPIEPVVSCDGLKIGKYYKHTGGGYLHIIGRLDTTMWGSNALIAESAGHGCDLRAVAGDAGSAINWQETTKKDWMTNFS